MTASRQPIPWTRVLVEGVVIVGSILMAFGIEAWWDGAQERAEEAQLLASLAEEFRANVDLTPEGHRSVCLEPSRPLAHSFARDLALIVEVDLQGSCHGYRARVDAREVQRGPSARLLAPKAPTML